MEQYIGQFEIYLLTEKRSARNTVSAYMQDLRQFESYLSKRELIFNNLDLVQLKAYLTYLRKNKALSARSMSRKISALKVFYNFLAREHDHLNLAQSLNLPKLEKRLPKFLTELEVEQLLTCANQDKTDLGVRNRTMISLLYVTGMRVSELTNLKISDIRFDTGFITVSGKGGKERLVPVPKEFLLELEQNYLKTAHANLSGKSNLNSSACLFPVLYGAKIRPITRQAFWQILKNLAKQANIQSELSPHKLRHSLATHLLRKGANLRLLQMLLGHENLSTVQIYTHVDVDYLRSIYDKRHPRS